MKNNFIAKIIGATLAFAMMIGGAVGINAAKEAKEVNATGEEWAATSDTYERVSSISAGDKIIIVAANYDKAMGAQGSNLRGTAAVTKNQSGTELTVDADNAVAVFTVGEETFNSAACYTFFDGSGYLNDNSQTKSGSNQNYLTTVNSLDTSGGKTHWAVTFSNGIASIIAKGQRVGTGRYTMSYNYNSGNDRISCYTGIQGTGQLSIFKKIEVTSEVDTVTASIKEGAYYAGNQLSELDFDVTVTWTNGKADTHPTGGFAWTVNGAANGALQEGNNTVILTYQEVTSNEFTVIATIEPGTVRTNPLTSTAAIAIGENLAHNAETTKDYFVQGTVSEVTYNSLATESKQATFWLLDGETIRGFQAYNIGVDNECTNYSDLLVGAVVLIQGKIKKYNSTIESGTNAKILSISYTAPVLTGITLNKTASSLEVGNTDTLVASPVPNIAELGTVTWISSNNFVAKVEDGVVTAITGGSATITAFIDENGNGVLDNEEINATCAVTVTAAPAEKVVAVNSISAGDTVFMFATGVSQQFNGIGGSGTSTYGSGVSYTGTPNKDGLAFEVVDGNADDSFAFKFKSGTYADKYIAWNSGNYLIVSDAINDGSSWSVSFDSENNATISNVKNSDRVIWWNVSSPRFSCYTDKTDGASYKYTQLGKVMSPTVYLESSTTIKTISGTEVEDTISNVALRFGAIVPVSTWTSINANWTITDYGVMFARESMLTARSKTSLEEVFRNNPDDIAIVHKQTFAAPVASGDEYYFTARLVLEESDYDTVFYAAPYIVAGGAYYFLQEEHDSVRTLANNCYNNGGSSLSQAALTTLKGND